MEQITVLLADDNLIVREGVRALLATDPGVRVVALAADYDELLQRASEVCPQVVVTDIRMPPTFQDEGIQAAQAVRRARPDTGIVVLSQYEEPEYALSLLSDGAEGFAYLLKDRIADGGLLGRAVRAVAAGGSLLDPEIDALLTPAQRAAPGLSSLNFLPGAPALASRPGQSAAPPLAIPAARVGGAAVAGRQAERLTVSVLMSDVRGYSAIAERTDPVVLAGQLDAHRRELSAAIAAEGGTVVQYVGDAVLAVFGAPSPRRDCRDHAARAIRAATRMHERQRALNERWVRSGLAPFLLGIGVSTGEVAGAVLGSADRMEYTLVGDTVNLADRLQDMARPGGTTVVSEATAAAVTGWPLTRMPACQVKGRTATVRPFQLAGEPPVTRSAALVAAGGGAGRAA